MSGGDPCDGLIRNRRVLGDVTNSCGKRGLPLVPGKFVLGNAVEGACSWKRACGGVDNLDKRKGSIGSVPKICKLVEDNEKYLPNSRNLIYEYGKGPSLPKAMEICGSLGLSYNGERAQADIDFNTSCYLNRMKEPSGSLNCVPHFTLNNFRFDRTTEAKELRDSCIASVSEPLQCDKTRDSSLVAEEGYRGHCGTGIGDITRNDIQAEVKDGDKFELEVGKFSPSTNSNLEFVNLKENQMNSSECLINEPLDKSCMKGDSKPTESLDSELLKLEETENVQSTFCGNHDLNVEQDIFSGSNCSCSFCLKAACIWMDLLYQDARDRLSEIKKSRRKARFLVESYNHDCIDASAENPKKFARLEFDLMQHWRSLFLHTENRLMCESTQLQSHLLRLKELRENCKRNLEMINKVSSSKS